MVQGGYNAALNPADSVDAHFLDTLQGGQWINDQELAWTLVNLAPKRILELENRYGCFFDRNPDGTIHQKAFAAQSFDRTVHRGDLTGIEIINRLSEQVRARDIPILEECRAVALLNEGGIPGAPVVGALLLDVRTGRFVAVSARAMLLATGGGPTCYKITAASADKAMDGLALAYRAGATLMDMEMVQFHPTGLMAARSQMTGTVLEEGLRGAGGYLLNGRGERFMERYDPERMERSTRDVVSRSSYLEIMAGRGTKNGGVMIDVSHLGAEFVKKQFPGMWARCRDAGFDLAREPVEVSPTAHFMMGGVRIDPTCHSDLPGLYVAGEDSAGVHGANRLGGNGVAESIVFGGVAGDVMAEEVAGLPRRPLDAGQIAAEIEAALPQPESGLAMQQRDVANPKSKIQNPKSTARVPALRDALKALMWEKVGLVRSRESLEGTLAALPELAERTLGAEVVGGRTYNLDWQGWLNLQSFLCVAEMIARGALLREESRGSHFRDDFPATDNDRWLCNTRVVREGEAMRLSVSPVALPRLSPLEPESDANRLKPVR
jgi:succinate dehydrogenase/fumarate reductase flavoprotein subunit